MSDIVINKIQSIQRCIQRAREEYAVDPGSFATNFSRQDAAILNIVRACETAIDLANHVIRTHKLGIPTSTSDSFRLLKDAQVIDPQIAEQMHKMVGFRNTVVHQYAETDLNIVVAVLRFGLDDLLQFADIIRKSSVSD